MNEKLNKVPKTLGERYAKLLNVINSVKTEEQFKVAKKYAQLFVNNRYKEMRVSDIWDWSFSKDVDNELKIKLKEIKDKEELNIVKAIDSKLGKGWAKELAEALTKNDEEDKNESK